MKGGSWNRLIRSAVIALFAIGTLFVSVIANAACGDPTGAKSGLALKLPFLAQPRSESRQPNGKSSIVGLWHVTYDTGGQLFYESFDQWHRDGTELENPNLPPIGGSVCVGVWKTTPSGIVRLNHVGWNFDSNGNSTGTFSLGERNIVSADGNTYRGVFDYKSYDVDGNLLVEIKGTQTATRITVK
jgi:hypothetical protein